MINPRVFARLRRRAAVTPNGCWEWCGALHTTGYGWTADPDLRRPNYAHRVMFKAARGPIPAGLWVLHRCDNRRCINPDHFFLGTRGDNSADMVAKGRQYRGARHWTRTHPERVMRGETHVMAVLSASDVDEIRRRRKAGEALRSLADEFGVSDRTISRIARGTRWTCLPRSPSSADEALAAAE